MINRYFAFLFMLGFLVSCDSENNADETIECIDSEDGTVFEGKFYVDRKLYTGCVERNDSISPRAMFPLKKGVLDGEYIEYYPNDQVKMIQEYSDGKKHGRYVIYWENNAISDSMNYVNDNPDGEVLGYYPNGSERSWGYCKNGVSEGASIVFLDSTKQRYFWGETKNNVNIGDWYYKFESDSCLIRTFTDNNNSFETPCECADVKYPPRDKW